LRSRFHDPTQQDSSSVKLSHVGRYDGSFIGANKNIARRIFNRWQQQQQALQLAAAAIARPPPLPYSPPSGAGEGGTLGGRAACNSPSICGLTVHRQCTRRASDWLANRSTWPTNNFPQRVATREMTDWTTSQTDKVTKLMTLIIDVLHIVGLRRSSIGDAGAKRASRLAPFEPQLRSSTYSVWRQSSCPVTRNYRRVRSLRDPMSVTRPVFDPCSVGARRRSSGVHSCVNFTVNSLLFHQTSLLWCCCCCCGGGCRCARLQSQHATVSRLSSAIFHELARYDRSTR